MRWFMNLCLILTSWMIGTFIPLQGKELILKENLQLAQPGDYLVISASKTQTLMHIHSKRNQFLSIEEITVPSNKSPSKNWKEWIQQGAPGNTSWVMYDIDLSSGEMTRYYSFSKKNWFEIPEADNFLYKLLNLKFVDIPDNARKRIGPKSDFGPDMRSVWQPSMVVEGQTIKGIKFDAWRTKWPKDGSELSSKVIEVYLPSDSQRYPAYFPYWLQIQGTIGKAKVRIIDSGSHLQSPRSSFPTS